MNDWIKTFKQKYFASQSRDLDKTYFQQANDWSDDYYLAICGSRNRYRTAFFCVLLCCVALTFCISILVPMQHFEPLLVHHYESGAVHIEPIQSKQLPLSTAQTESDIVRYIVNRESYSHFSFSHQYDLVNLLSSEKVSVQYQHDQNPDESYAFLSRFSDKYSRIIHIESIIFLNDSRSENQKNLAEVNFTATVTNLHTGHQSEKNYVATLSWVYQGIPKSLSTRWQNWSGFTVTNYQVSQRSL